LRTIAQQAPGVADRISMRQVNGGRHA